MGLEVYAGFFKDAVRLYPADAYVVVDVLRFSTTVATALYLGTEEVVVYADLEEALRAAKDLGVPLIAEVEGFRPEGADLDNSPTALLSSFRGRPPKKLVIRTTSGALVIEEAIKVGLREVLVGALVNARAVANYIVSRGFNSVAVIMAGYKRSMFAIDDMLGAGAIITELENAVGFLNLLTDEALVARELYVKAAYEGRVLELMSSGRAGKFLIATGRLGDVEYSAKQNILAVVPRLREGTRSLVNAQP